MQMPTGDRTQAKLSRLIQQAGPVATVVVSVLIIILGILVIHHPELLAWAVGISMILAGAALLTSLIAAATKQGT